MKKVRAQMKKELAQFVRDRLTVALAFFLPLLSMFLFGFGVRGGSEMEGSGRRFRLPK
jgi:ABC-2 type transport system permease protein